MTAPPDSESSSTTASSTAGSQRTRRRSNSATGAPPTAGASPTPRSATPSRPSSSQTSTASTSTRSAGHDQPLAHRYAHTAARLCKEIGGLWANPRLLNYDYAPKALRRRACTLCQSHELHRRLAVAGRGWHGAALRDLGKERSATAQFVDFASVDARRRIDAGPPHAHQAGIGPHDRPPGRVCACRPRRP